VRAVIAESYERIHRSNLIGMGVLPLQFKDGESWKTLGLDGDEAFDIDGLTELEPGGMIKVAVTTSDGSKRDFEAKIRIDGDVELEYYRNGGILQTVLKKLAGA
jgi:aconitate hydratase